jgi:hypothetical protein
MKFQSYLNEKYVNTARGYSGISGDIFVNPNSKEIREINMKHGFRFIADMVDKKVYVWNDSTAIHADVMNLDNKITPFSYGDYIGGTGIDRYFAGLQEASGFVESDTWSAILYRSEKHEDKIKKMRSHDTKWLAKYGINVKGVEQAINRGV